jgi:hypothetical protein
VGYMKITKSGLQYNDHGLSHSTPRTLKRWLPPTMRRLLYNVSMLASVTLFPIVPPKRRSATGDVFTEMPQYANDLSYSPKFCCPLCHTHKGTLRICLEKCVSVTPRAWALLCLPLAGCWDVVRHQTCGIQVCSQGQY